FSFPSLISCCEVLSVGILLSETIDWPSFLIGTQLVLRVSRVEFWDFSMTESTPSKTKE
ncbi:unnamed protein product, partial [Gulo gulo]